MASVSIGKFHNSIQIFNNQIVSSNSIQIFNKRIYFKNILKSFWFLSYITGIAL
jgi:hypothetical protein